MGGARYLGPGRNNIINVDIRCNKLGEPGKQDSVTSDCLHKYKFKSKFFWLI